MNEEGFERLKSAIIFQAVKDYSKWKKRFHNADPNSIGRAIAKDRFEEVKNFFLGEWFDFMVPDVSGKVIVEKLDDNYKNYGRCIIGAQKSQLL